MADVTHRTETDVRERILVVLTNARRWQLRAVVVAPGACETPFSPLMAQAVESSVLQMFPADYRHLEQLPRRAP
jgi:hypothetical protein